MEPPGGPHTRPGSSCSTTAGNPSDNAIFAPKHSNPPLWCWLRLRLCQPTASASARPQLNQHQQRIPKAYRNRYQRGREKDKTIKPFIPPTPLSNQPPLSTHRSLPTTNKHSHLSVSLDPASDEPRPHSPTTSHTTQITTPTPSKATTAHCDHDTFLPLSTENSLHLV